VRVHAQGGRTGHRDDVVACGERAGDAHAVDGDDVVARAQRGGGGSDRGEPGADRQRVVGLRRASTAPPASWSPKPTASPPSTDAETPGPANAGAAPSSPATPNPATTSGNIGY
jgi:hypothetical protein